MSEIRYEGKSIWYINGEKRQILIDLRRCIENISRIPLIDNGEVEVSLIEIISRLQEIHGQIDPDAENTQFDYTLLDFLTARCCMRSALPLHVVEIGGMNGIWSFHLAFMLGQYHPSSLLCSVCNRIGNESGNQWLDRISLVGEPPRLSLLAADYENTMLQREGFDLVAINESEIFEQPYEVVKEAERLVKKGGVILCYAKAQSVLAHTLVQTFPESESYDTESGMCIYYINYDENLHNQPTENSWEEEAETYLENVKLLILDHPSKEQLRNSMKKLDEYVNRAIQEQKIDLKLRFIQCEEDVLDAMYPV